MPPPLALPCIATAGAIALRVSEDFVYGLLAGLTLWAITKIIPMTITRFRARGQKKTPESAEIMDLSLGKGWSRPHDCLRFTLRLGKPNENRSDPVTIQARPGGSPYGKPESVELLHPTLFRAWWKKLRYNQGEYEVPFNRDTHLEEQYRIEIKIKDGAYHQNFVPDKIRRP